MAAAGQQVTEEGAGRGCAAAVWRVKGGGVACPLPDWGRPVPSGSIDGAAGARRKVWVVGGGWSEPGEEGSWASKGRVLGAGGLCDGEGGRTEDFSCAKGASGNGTAPRAPGMVSSRHPTFSEVPGNGSARYRDVRVLRCQGTAGKFSEIVSEKNENLSHEPSDT